METIEQAGAIVFKRDRSEIKILLVTAKSNQNHWIFPKGHVDQGESLEVAALREAHEEAGVTGTVVGRTGSLSFTHGPTTYLVHYYLVVTQDEGCQCEGRLLAWLPYHQALERLSFESSRGLLRDAWPIMTRVRHPDSG